MGFLADLFGVTVGAKVVTKDFVRKMEGGLDFIPRGEFVAIDSLEFRPTNNLELFQCCQQTGNDPQSGPYYCGKVAELVAGNRNKYVGLCQRHAQGCADSLRWASPESKDSLL